MQSLMVLTDFSDASFRAAKYAGMLAEKLKSKRLILLHAFQAIPAVSNEPIVSAGRESLREEALKMMEIWKESINQFLPASTQTSFLVNEIDLAKDINTQCRENQIDLVVMGMTGKTGMEKILIGSNTIRVMKEIRFPLLVIPQNAPSNLPQKALLATDLKNVEDKTSVPALTALLDTLKPELLVVNVAVKEPPVPKLTTEITALHASFDKYQPKYHYLNGQDTAGEINAFAVDNKADLIITIHEKHGGLGELFHMSVSKRLAWHSQIPLLVIPL